MGIHICNMRINEMFDTRLTVESLNGMHTDTYAHNFETS